MAERLPGELAADAGAPTRGSAVAGRVPCGPARAARPRSSPRARPGRAGRPGRAAPPAPRARGRRGGHAGVDAHRGGRRPAVRTLDPAVSPEWTSCRRPWRAHIRARRWVRASWPPSRSWPPPDRRVLAAELAGRHGQAAVAGLVRRGLVAGRGPRASTPTPRRTSQRVPRQPPGVERPAAGPGGRRRADPGRDRRRQRPAAPARWRDGCRQDRDLRRGDRRRARGRPAGARARPEIALALPLVDRLRADLDARIALLHSGLGDGERADEWRRIRAGDVDIVVGTRLAVTAPLADIGLGDRRRGARRRLQERSDAAPAGSRLRDPAGCVLPVQPSSLVRQRRPSTASGTPTPGDVRPGRPRRPTRRAGRRPSRSWTYGRSSLPGSAVCCRGRSSPRWRARRRCR